MRPQQLLRSRVPQLSSSPELPPDFLDHALEKILNQPVEPSAVAASETLVR
jgi:hypothetical protein